MKTNSQHVKIGDIIPFGIYNWRVLDIQDDKALVLTENIIKNCEYNESQEEITWKTCDLRKYLNSDFLQTFTEEERKDIIETQIINNDNLWYEAKGGENTIDKIFLLSLEEINKYFGNSGDYINKRRMNINEGIFIDIDDGPLFSNIRDLTKTSINKKYFLWWLRSPGVDNKHAAVVIGDGDVFVVYGQFVNFDGGSVRPALWLNLQTFTSKENFKKYVSQPVKTGNIIPFGNYNWRVLEVQNNKALILTDNIIDKRNFHEEHKIVTWETCDLRKYLNGEFLQKFSEEEQSRIVEIQIENNDNLWFHAKGGNDTSDKIFLLSLEESDKYFGNSGDYINKRQKNCESSDMHKDYFSNYYNNERIAKLCNEEYWWWLRSPGFTGFTAAYVEDYGAVCVMGNDVKFYIPCGVRPALWLRF